MYVNVHFMDEILEPNTHWVAICRKRWGIRGEKPGLVGGNERGKTEELQIGSENPLKSGGEE